MAKRLALITGGTTGIGAAICKALSAQGYDVAASYVTNDARARQFANDTGISVYKWDVTDFAQCAQGVQTVCTDFGRDIEVLVNNAGITRDAVMHKIMPEEWQYMIATNLTSCFNMSHAVIGGMRENRFGRIVSISSVNGQLGQVGQTHYCAAKAGIIGFTKALARESASKDITVNTISPGYTQTGILKAMSGRTLDAVIGHIPVGRLALPEEIARAVVWVVSDDASFITGATFPINSGQSIH